MSRQYAMHVVVVLAAVSAPASAIFIERESRQVPVDRLVANLERAAKDQPRDPQVQINLARLHAMAYALKTEEMPATAAPNSGVEVPFYPPGGSQVAPKVAPATSPEHGERASRHLKSAIQHYDAALELAPDNMTARLGRGWALQQSGEKSRAIDDYRRAIALAWPQEEKTKTLMPGQRFITQEAIEYLLPLLDPQRDAAEISDLQSKQTALKNRPRAITPIVVPLDDEADVASILDTRARVRFDADGSALDREWTWITPRAGWLVYDHDGHGQITSALQLFGNVTFWLFWSNGYESMAALDDDGNRRLEENELRQLAIWRDVDGNGRSDKGEVSPLAAHRIVALSFDYVQGDGQRVAAAAPRGVTLRDGRTRPTYDVILRHAGGTFTN